MSNTINYELFLNRAMRLVVKDALLCVIENGMPGKHFFYISFLTDFNGIKLSSSLQKKHPKEMTIVLQHQFTDLVVEDDRFSVILSFNGRKESLCVPYKAITHFSDPSAKMELKFTILEDYNDNQTKKNVIDFNEKIKIEQPAANVISLDQLRKNKR